MRPTSALERSRRRTAGVRDEDVDAAELSQRLACRPARRSRGFDDVGDDRVDLGAGAASAISSRAASSASRRARTSRAFAPSAASSTAIARPRPRLAAATSATFPRSPRSMRYFRR